MISSVAHAGSVYICRDFQVAHWDMVEEASCASMCVRTHVHSGFIMMVPSSTSEYLDQCKNVPSGLPILQQLPLPYCGYTACHALHMGYSMLLLLLLPGCVSHRCCVLRLLLLGLDCVQHPGEVNGHQV